MVGIVSALLPAMTPVPLKEILPNPLPNIAPLLVRLPPMPHVRTSATFQPLVKLPPEKFIKCVPGPLTIKLPPMKLDPCAPSKSSSSPLRKRLLTTVKLSEEQSQAQPVPMTRLPPTKIPGEPESSLACCTLIAPIKVISPAITIGNGPPGLVLKLLKFCHGTNGGIGST